MNITAENCTLWLEYGSHTTVGHSRPGLLIFLLILVVTFCENRDCFICNWRVSSWSIALDRPVLEEKIDDRKFGKQSFLLSCEGPPNHFLDRSEVSKTTFLMSCHLLVIFHFPHWISMVPNTPHRCVLTFHRFSYTTWGVAVQDDDFQWGHIIFWRTSAGHEERRLRHFRSVQKMIWESFTW